jgi:hypothetical protein
MSDGKGITATANATISYEVNDDRGAIGKAMVIVNLMVILNQAPVAQNDIASKNDQTSITFNVLANDPNPDDDELILVSATSTNGNVITNSKVVYILFQMVLLKSAHS